ncbi:MAG: oxidoreductase [Mycobacterium sp.]
MGLFDRFRRGRAARGGDPAADLRYLHEWTTAHTGVEAFVEPKTTVTELTVVLVAHDGEWTRRRVGGEAGARRLSSQLQIPVYDVQKVGYPQRMRDYDARRRIERRRALRDELERPADEGRGTG